MDHMPLLLCQTTIYQMNNVYTQSAISSYLLKTKSQTALSIYTIKQEDQSLTVNGLIILLLQSEHSLN